MVRKILSEMLKKIRADENVGYWPDQHKTPEPGIQDHLDNQHAPAESSAAGWRKPPILLLITYIFFGIAWLLLFVSLLLPQVRWFFREMDSTLTGIEVALLAPLAAVGALLQATFDQQTILILAIVLSELLFLMSPFILIWRNAGLFWRVLYWMSNLLCLILFIAALPQTLHFSVPEGQGETIFFLPNLFVWFSAQVALALATSVQLFSRYVK